MRRDKGIAYCGLACAVCGQNETCAGCRNEGCKGKEWCKNFACCKEKGLNGCWECNDFPCSGGMLDKVKIRAFASFIKNHGEDEFLECLENNEKNGIVYHYPASISGDYDKYETEEEIMEKIKNEGEAAKSREGS